MCQQLYRLSPSQLYPRMTGEQKQQRSSRQSLLISGGLPRLNEFAQPYSTESCNSAQQNCCQSTAAGRECADAAPPACKGLLMCLVLYLCVLLTYAWLQGDGSCCNCWGRLPS